MSAAVLTVPARPDTGADRRRAMLALARVESGRMLRSPVTIAAAVLFLLPWAYGWVTGTANKFPVLHEEALTMQPLGLLILGNGALIAANLAALRAHRHRANALFDVLVLPAAWRTAALLLAVLPCAGLAVVLVGARTGVQAALPGAAGRLIPAQLLTIPALVLLFGTLGVLLARLATSAVIAPLVALVVTATALVVPTNEAPGTSLLLFPVVFAELPMPLPADLAGRPAGRHLAYLVGLVLVLATVALVRSGARRIVVPAVLAVALTVGGGVTQFRSDDAVRVGRATVADKPAALQTCRTMDGVRYCAFDDFTPWIDSWDVVLRSVRRAVPADAAIGPPLAVRQRVRIEDYPQSGEVISAEQVRQKAAAEQRANAAAGTPEAIPVGTTWGDPPSAAVFASAVAFRLITGHAGGDDPSSVCGARGALLVWLVGQAGQKTADGLYEFDEARKTTDGLHKLDESSWNALGFADSSGYSGISVTDEDAAAGLALLDKPVAEATALVRRHWTELTLAATGADRFAALMGVPAAPQPPAAERSTCVN